MRKQNRSNKLVVLHDISDRLMWMRKSGFLQLSLAKLEIPASFAEETATRRVGDRGGRGAVAASQLEQKLCAQYHALAGTRSRPSMDQRDRGGSVTDADQEGCVRPIEVTVSGKQRIRLLIFAPCSRRIASAGKDGGGRGVGPVGLRMILQQRHQLRTIVAPGRETSGRAPSAYDRDDRHRNGGRTETAALREPGRSPADERRRQNHREIQVALRQDDARREEEVRGRQIGKSGDTRGKRDRRRTTAAPQRKGRNAHNDDESQHRRNRNTRTGGKYLGVVID